MAAVRVVEVVYREIDSDGFRRAREATKVSATKLSERIGQHDQYVSRLERGLVKDVPKLIYDALIQELAKEAPYCDEAAPEQAVLDVIEGRASFQLRLVQGGSQPTPEGTRAKPDLTVIRLPLPDLRGQSRSVAA